MPELFNPGQTSFGPMSPYVGFTKYRICQSKLFCTPHLPELLQNTQQYLNSASSLPKKSGKMKTMLTEYEDCISQTMTMLKFISEQINEKTFTYKLMHVVTFFFFLQSPRKPCGKDCSSPHLYLLLDIPKFLNSDVLFTIVKSVNSQQCS